MGHHIDADGRFQSDKYPELTADKIILSFRDPRAINALLVLASAYDNHDDELAADIRNRLHSIQQEA